MGSGNSENKQQSFAEYEKDYLERLKKIKEGQNLQNLIFDLSTDFKNPEVINTDYIGHCTFCRMGVAREEMAYKNSQLFHSNCFDQQGKNFPAPNQEFLKQNSKAKVELVQLKNLKIRTMGTSNPGSIKPKTKKKSKSKTKKRRPKRRVTKIKRTSTKRKKTKKRTSRRKPSKRRRVVKRRTLPKRKKTKRKTKRRVSRRAKRKARRRR